MEAHELRFIKKQNKMATPQPSTSNPPTPSPNVIEGLVGMDLITETPGVSISVLVNAVKSAHIILTNVTNWELQNNKLIVSSDDSETLTLVFISLVEAQLGLTRFETAMNGGTI